MYELEPLVGAGPVRLGMTRKEVRAAVGHEATEFMKGPTDTRSTDAFDGNRLQVFYDEHDRAEFIELSRAARMSRGSMGLTYWAAQRTRSSKRSPNGRLTSLKMTHLMNAGTATPFHRWDSRSGDRCYQKATTMMSRTMSTSTGACFIAWGSPRLDTSFGHRAKGT